MDKPKNYDNTSGYSTYTQLPPGGYVCVIRKVEETKSSNSNPMLKIYLDICEGEYTKYYEKRYTSDTRSTKHWGCVMNQVTIDGEGNCSRGLKTFCDAVAASNPGFNVDAAWGLNFCDNYKGKKIGVLFQREEYLSTKGERKWAVKCFAFRSADEIRAGVEVPEDIPLSVVDNNKSVGGSTYTPGFVINEDDDDLPF